VDKPAPLGHGWAQQARSETGTPQLINVDVMRTPSPETTPLSSDARYAADQALPSPLPVSSPPTVDVDNITEGYGVLRPQPSQRDGERTVPSDFLSAGHPWLPLCPQACEPRW
jgi:hypothetical protein